MPMIGQAIPEGTYQTYHHNEIQSAALRGYQRRWLVLLFYPCEKMLKPGLDLVGKI